jgi:beta-1,4-N-acetylglucosaminyltransferase
MIFVAVGTHPDQFDRLIRKIDEIAPKIKEKIIIQRGFTKYVPKNVESFDFKPDIDEYYKNARLVIVQSATSLLEFSLKYKKPVITVPRQAKYKEHINDHQVEFAVYFAEKTGILAVLDMNQLTPELLKSYKKIPLIKKDGLIQLQDYFIDLFEKLNKNDK